MPTPRSAPDPAPPTRLGKPTFSTAEAPGHRRRSGWRLPKAPAPALVLTAIASVQIGAALAKGMFGSAGPAGTVLLRLGFAALVLLLVVRPRRATWRAPAGLGRSGATVVLFGLLLAAMNLSFYEAIARIPLGVAVTVEFVGPLGVAVAGSRRWLDGLWVLLAGGGVVLLAGGGGHVSLTGVLLALVAGGCWAGYILTSQRVGRAFPGATGLALALAVGAVVLLPIGIVGGGRALWRPGVLATGFAVAMLSSAVPYSLELAALRRLPTAVFGVLMSLEPAMAAAAGFVVLAESLRIRQLVAMAAVCVASAGATWARPKAARDP